MPLQLPDLLTAGSLASAITTGEITPGGTAAGYNLDTLLDLSSRVQGTGALGALQNVVSLAGNLADAYKDAAGGGSGVTLAGVFLALIKRVSKSFQEGASETNANWTEARVRLVGNNSGRVPTAFLPSIGCDRAGAFRFVRKFILDALAKDRCVPYSDPLGTLNNQHTDWYDGRAVGDKVPGIYQFRPYGLSLARWGWWWSNSCTDWSVILLDGGDQDCEWSDILHAGDYVSCPEGCPPETIRLTIVWPYAYPLISPARMQGTWGKSSGSESEAVAAALYLLPTPQHVTTRVADVQAAQVYLRRAFDLHYPGSYRDDAGRWVRNQPVEYWAGPRPTFTEYVEAMTRIRSFYRTRIVLKASRELLPKSLTDLMVGEDW